MLVDTGCTSQSLEEAQVDFCPALVAYGEAVRDLQNVNDGTTVEELQSALDDAADARNAVGDAAVGLREALCRSAVTAWEYTQAAINDISGDDTLGESDATVRGQAAFLFAEIERIGNISCGRR